MINFKDCTVSRVIDKKNSTAIQRSSHLVLFSILTLFYNFYCLKGTRTTQLLISYYLLNIVLTLSDIIAIILNIHWVLWYLVQTVNKCLSLNLKKMCQVIYVTWLLLYLLQRFTVCFQCHGVKYRWITCIHTRFMWKWKVKIKKFNFRPIQSAISKQQFILIIPAPYV